MIDLQTLRSKAAASRLPHLLFCATPFAGHTLPLVVIASELIHHGYEITFLVGEEFQAGARKAGVQNIVIIPPPMTAEEVAKREATPAGLPRLLYDMEVCFLQPMKLRKEIVYETLERLRKSDPSREIVIVTESFFMGTLPLYFGAPLPKGFTIRPRIVNIHTSINMVASVDTVPFGLGHPPDASEEGCARNKAANEAMLSGPYAGIVEMEKDIMAKYGAAGYKAGIPWDTWITSHDVVLQLTPPSIEYPRSDLHSKMKYIGALTPRPISKDFVYPSWWDEVTRWDRKVVMVTQGTVGLNYSNLLIPALEALADRQDVLVVAVLGKKGASLPSDFSVPSNARILDHLPYDAILPYSSVFVFNAGLGGFTHGIINGVPMVMAGVAEDKPEVAMRGEWAGIAINLKTEKPNPKEIGDAVDLLLQDGSYTKRVGEIRRENESMEAMETIELAILEELAKS